MENLKPGCRVAVPSQDPIVAITCILHSSGDAALAEPGQQAVLLGNDDGLADDEGVGPSNFYRLWR